MIQHEKAFRTVYTCCNVSDNKLQLPPNNKNIISVKHLANCCGIKCNKNFQDVMFLENKNGRVASDRASGEKPVAYLICGPRDPL